MLSPGIMISACGLLILEMNNKYSLVVNRIRLHSLSTQFNSLGFRVKLVRNSVVADTIVVGSFALASLSISAGYFLNNPNINYVITGSFLAGMLTVLAGATYAAYESIKGYDIIHFEVKTDE
jgi:hypothetical protein